MKEINEEQALELTLSPHKITDAYTCNLVIGFLAGHISDMAQATWELKVIASNHKVELLNQKDKTVALKEAEWYISQPYIQWQEMLMKLQKLRSYRNNLKDKQEDLRGKPNNYSNPGPTYSL